MTPTFRQALPTEAPLVTSILHEVAQWLISRNLTMWTEEELRQDHLIREVHAGLYFVAYVDTTPAGIFRFQLEDTLFWPDLPEPNAAYIHRLAIRRPYAGGVLSSAIYGFAADRARSFNRQYLRLDCDADRPRLRAAYERAGFQLHSYRHVGPWYVSRYQLPIRVEPTPNMP
jgi:GNAT superfamily N-acetyltransferase